MSTIQKTSAQLKLYLLLKRVLQSLLIPVLFIAVWAVASAFHGQPAQKRQGSDR